MQIDVLNNGYVRLVDHMGSDLSVVRSARVSYNADWRAGEDAGSDARLIHYLWRNKHTSPFESVEFTFEVKAPIFILRQWHRHRTWSYNEISGRYTKMSDDYYVPSPTLVGVQSPNNKQSRTISSDQTVEQKNKAKFAASLVDDVCRNAFVHYHTLLKMGVPRELARSVLPLATYSRMWAKVDLLNLLKFLSLRTHEHAQYEIRVYAQAILELIRPHVPVCVAAWETGGVMKTK